MSIDENIFSIFETKFVSKLNATINALLACLIKNFILNKIYVYMSDKIIDTQESKSVFYVCLTMQDGDIAGIRWSR